MLFVIFFLNKTNISYFTGNTVTDTTTLYLKNIYVNVVNMIRKFEERKTYEMNDSLKSFTNVNNFCKIIVNLIKTA